MTASYAEPVLWGTVVVIGVATFAIRGSFVALLGRLDEVPSRLERVLRYVPAAVLAALVAPSIVAFDPATGGVAVDKLVAGGLAAAVAWRTENVFATMTVGMVALWAVRFLV